MAAITKNFVTFYSPGTFVPEETTKEIPEWSVPLALRMSEAIVERYDSKPHCFVFTTRERGDADFESKETARSCRYFIRGRIETLAQVEARDDPRESILRSNMRGNNIARVCVTESPWKNVAAMEPTDVVLDADGREVRT